MLNWNKNVLEMFFPWVVLHATSIIFDQSSIGCTETSVLINSNTLFPNHGKYSLHFHTLRIQQNCFSHWELSWRNFSTCPKVRNELKIMVECFLCGKMKYLLTHATNFHLIHTDLHTAPFLFWNNSVLSIQTGQAIVDPNDMESQILTVMVSSFLIYQKIRYLGIK